MHGGVCRMPDVVLFANLNDLAVRQSRSAYHWSRDANHEVAALDPPVQLHIIHPTIHRTTLQ